MVFYRGRFGRRYAPHRVWVANFGVKIQIRGWYRRADVGYSVNQRRRHLTPHSALD